MNYLKLVLFKKVMSNVFIDCGTHFGQGLEEVGINRFGIDSSWIVHTFEANPVTFKMLEYGYTPSLYIDGNRTRLDYVHYHNEAISTYDGIVSLNIESSSDENYNPTGQGTSIIPLDKWNPHNGATKHFFNKTCDVSCIDFSKYILDNFNKDDFIVIKMDIEGAEYDVLEHMIEKNVLHYINHIIIEFHAHFFTNKEEILTREEKLIQYFIENSIQYERWI